MRWGLDVARPATVGSPLLLVPPPTEERSMSLSRIHNFSISLDGFATGEPQSAEAPFGHAGQRLHRWMMATRYWDEATGGVGVDNAFAERHTPGIGAEI